MAVNYQKLKGRIVEKYGSQANFAVAFGISENAMSKKLTGETAISLKDIEKMSAPEMLDIETSEYSEYFFT